MLATNCGISQFPQELCIGEMPKKSCPFQEMSQNGVSPRLYRAKAMNQQWQDRHRPPPAAQISPMNIGSLRPGWATHGFGLTLDNAMSTASESHDSTFSWELSFHDPRFYRD